jgi:hypothetical protein
MEIIISKVQILITAEVYICGSNVDNMWEENITIISKKVFYCTVKRWVTCVVHVARFGLKGNTSTGVGMGTAKEDKSCKCK